MAVRFELPPLIEQALRRDLGDLDGAAKEAALVELYRQDKLTHHELAQALNVSRLEVEEVLKQHHVIEDQPTPEEYEEALTRLRAITS